MKKSSQNKKGKVKLNKSIFIILFLFILLIIGFYYFFGLEIALILALGISIILFVARLLDLTKKKKKQRKILKTILIIFLILGILGVISVTTFLGYVVMTAPEFDKSKLNESQSTILYDNKGREFAKLGSQIRENIEYQDLPEIFIDALIATEDSRYFQHNGIDLARFSKAVIGQLLGKSDAGGGSTISMQVIKNSFTDSTSSGIAGIIRKFTDIYLAVFKLEKNYTKEQIIEFYVNNHGLGGAWGVEEASKYYFGKSAKDMNLSEAALLAGMYQAPGSYNPYKNPEAAEKRRSTVLYLMVRHGYISQEEADLAKSIPVTSLLTYSSNNQSVYQGYIDTLCEEIEEKYGLDPYQTSMLIYTNMDREKQDALNAIARGETYAWIDDYVQTGIVAVESETGKVVALLSGRNQEGKKLYNFTTDINRQIGSTAKPLFDYAPGIEYNNWSTYTMFDDSPYTYSSGQSIRNYDSQYRGLITLRYALSDSRNVPALKAFQQVDKKKVINLVTSVGITPEISGNTIHEAHAIGAFNGSNPMEMAGAYQIFSNGGYYTEPYTVSKIVLRTTGESFENTSQTKQVISNATSYMIADVLKDVVTNRMRNSKYRITDNFAVKTGTTNYPSNMWSTYPSLASDAISDCWVMGFTNKISVAIWYGYKELDPNNLDRVLHWYPAIRQREDLFNVVANAVFDHDGTDFVKPNDVVEVGVELGSNPPMLPSSNTPKDKIVYELFKKGMEPTEVSSTYSKLDTPTNFSVSYKNDKVYLSWNKVSDPGYLANGTLGYYIYFDGEFIDFTTKTNYTIDNLDSYIGTYSIKAGYKDTETSRSDSATQTLKSTVSYSLSLKGKNTTYLEIGDGISKDLYDGSLVILKENDKNITDKIKNKITITIKNSSGDEVSEIKSDQADTYTITYKVNYNGFSNSISNKIVIKNEKNNDQEN